MIQEINRKIRIEENFMGVNEHAFDFQRQYLESE